MSLFDRFQMRLSWTPNITRVQWICISFWTSCSLCAWDIWAVDFTKGHWGKCNRHCCERKCVMLQYKMFKCFSFRVYIASLIWGWLHPHMSWVCGLACACTYTALQRHKAVTTEAVMEVGNKATAYKLDIKAVRDQHLWRWLIYKLSIRKTRPRWW